MPKNILKEKESTTNQKNLITNTELIKKTNEILAGTLDKEKLMEKAVSNFAEEMDLIGCGIFLIDETKQTVKSRYFTAEPVKRAEQFIKKSVRNIEIPLSKDDNFLAKTCVQKKEYISTKLADFGKGFFSEKQANLIQKLIKLKLVTTFPIIYNGKVIGALMTGHTNTNKLSKRMTVLLQTFANQIGLVMGSAIAHEKILKNHQKKIEKSSIKTSTKNLELISKTNQLFSGKLSFKEISDEAVSLFANDMGFVATSVFIKENNILRTCAFSQNKLTKIINKVLPVPMERITTPVDRPINYLGQTAKSGKTFIGTDIKDFADQTVSDKILKIIQKSTKVRCLFSLPIKNNDQIIGVLLCASPKKNFSKDQIETAKTFADQLRLAMQNVITHQNVIKEYEQKLEESDKKKGPLQDYLNIISSTNNFLTGELDFKKLAEKAVTEFCEKMDFDGVQLSRKKGNYLRACLYSKSKRTRFMSAIVPDKKFRKLKTPIKKPQNLAGKTALTGKIYTSDNIKEVCQGILSDKFLELIQIGGKSKNYITAPVKVNNKTEAVLIISTRRESFTSTEISVIKIFAEQLGLTMNNIISHEKIIKKYEEQQAYRKRNLDPDKKPNIKFTLRISREIERYLAWKIHNTNQTKADFLRGAITEELMQNDDDYKDFTKS